MAITKTSLTTGVTGGPTTTFNTPSVTPDANSLITIAIASHDQGSGDPGTPTVTGNGITYAQVLGGVFFNGGYCTHIFRGMAASPSAGAITIAFGTNQDFLLWSIMDFLGIDTSGTNGAGAIGLNGAAGAFPGSSVSEDLSGLGSLTSGSATYGLLYAHNDFAGTFTPGSGYTLVDAQNDGVSTNMGTEWRPDGQALIGFSYSSSQTLGVLGLEIKAAVLTEDPAIKHARRQLGARPGGM